MKFILYFIFGGLSYFFEGHAEMQLTPTHLKVWCYTECQRDGYSWAIVEHRGDTIMLDDGSIALVTANAVEIKDQDFHLTVIK